MLRVTQNGAYARMLRHITDHPGRTCAQIAAALGRNPKETRVVLGRFVARGLARVTADGPPGSRWGDRPLNRYWPGTPPPKAPTRDEYRAGLIADVQLHLDDHPGATRAEIAAALGLSPKRIKCALYRLCASGRVRAEAGEGRGRRYFLADDAIDPPPPSEREIAEMCEAIQAADGRVPEWSVPVVRLSVGRA